MDKQINFYLGREGDNGFTGYLAEDNFFLIIQITESYNKERGNKLILNIKQKINSYAIENLYQLEEFVQKIIIENNLPADFSLAAVFFKNNIAYLKTVNYGKIFLKRKNQLEEIISGNQSASGYIQLFDIFVLTTKTFTEKLQEKKDIKHFFNYNNPSEIINEITPILKSNDDSNLIALFIQIKEEQKESDFKINSKNPLDDLKKFFSKYLDRENINKKKTITYGLILIIFLIFIWSVFLGYKRRKEKEVNDRIKKTEQLVFSKLEKAEEIAFLNLEQAQILINEAKKETEDLKKQVNTKNKKIEEIDKIIIEKENQLIKKEAKNYQEFYDLTVDNKDAVGDELFLDKDTLLILNKNQGTIYALSLEKKSLEKFNNEKIKNAKIIAADNEKIYFFVEGEGVYQIFDKKKIKKIIDKDKDWGQIIDISTYNGNLYLLDIKKDEVYKYLPTGDGFSSKTSYFKTGEAVDLGDANSLAIDSSLYIGFSQAIFKFTSGIKESFKNNFPNKNFQIKRIYTDKETTKVYVWDKSNGVIYILTKNGEYQEQITSAAIKAATDFVVYQNKIFLLAKNKIYTIE